MLSPKRLLQMGEPLIIRFAIFPFNHYTNRLMVTCGGIDTNRCT